MPQSVRPPTTPSLTSEVGRFLRARPVSLVLIGLLGVLLAGMIGWELRQSYLEARAAAQLASQHLSLLLKEQLEGAFNEIGLVLHDLAGKLPAEQVAKLDQLPMAERRAISSAMDVHLPSMPAVDGLAVLSPTGNILLSAGNARVSQITQPAYVKQLRDNPGLEQAFSPPTKMRGSQDLGFVVAQRISKPDGQLGGVVTAIVRLEYFNQLARRLELAGNPGFEHVFTLLDNDMVIVGRYPEVPDVIGKRAPQAEGLNEWVNGRSEGYAVMASPFDHIRRGYQFYRLDNFPFIAIVGVAERAYLGNWQLKAAAYGVAFVLLMLFMLSIVWRSWREAELARAIRSSTQRRLEQNEHIARMVKTLSRPMMLVRAYERTVAISNAAADQLTGYDTDALVGQPLSVLFLRPEHESEIMAAFASRQSVTDYELKLKRPDGNTFWAALSGSVIEYQDEPAYFISLTDISERKLAQETLWRRATIDPLTGTVNRGYFLERAQMEWLRATRYHHHLGLLILDLDQFKSINDSHGHDAGDAVLREFAARIKRTLRETDLFGRLGGEEFAVLMPEEPDVPSMLEVAERLRQDIEQAPFSLPDGGDIAVTVSIGCSLSTTSTPDLERLMKEADQALYGAKRGGRNRVVVHDDTSQA